MFRNVQTTNSTFVDKKMVCIVNNYSLTLLIRHPQYYGTFLQDQIV